MKRTFLLFALPSALLLTSSMVVAEEETSWGQVKRSTEAVAAPAAKVVTETGETFYNDCDEAGNCAPAGWTPTMQRHKTGINLKIKAPTGPGALDIKPGEEYIMDVAIFDNPAGCSDVLEAGCGADDMGFFTGIFTAEAQPTIIGPVVASGIAGAQWVNLNVHIKKGQQWDGVVFEHEPDVNGFSPDRTLDNPLGAEIHFGISHIDGTFLQFGTFVVEDE